MQKKLTISVDEDVYQGLHKIVGRGKISRFIEELVRPHVVSGSLQEAYQAMALDSEKETRATEWVDNLIEDFSDEER